MFDIGFWEILLILVLALVIIGPERLPGAAKKAGYWIGRGRRFVEGVRSEVESEFDVGEFKRLLHNQEVQINELQRQLKTEVTDIDDIRAELKESVMSGVPERYINANKTDVSKTSALSESNKEDELPSHSSNLAAEKTDTAGTEATADTHKDKQSI